MTNRYMQLFQVLSSNEFYTQERYHSNNCVDYLNALLDFQIWAQNNSEVPAAGYPISYVPGRSRKLSYPFYETSGYMVQTLIKYQAFKEHEIYRESARYTLDWFLNSANSDGSFPTNKSHFEFSSSPLIFDTGMILYGLIEGAVFFRDSQLLDLSKLTIGWLNRKFDRRYLADKNYTFSGDGRFRPYYIKVIHSLLNANAVLPGYVDVDLCIYIYRHVINQLEAGKLISQAGFSNSYIHLHTVAYSIESLLKIAILIDDKNGIKSIKKFVDKKFLDKLPAAYLRYRNNPVFLYRCLVGEAQVAEVLYMLYSLFNDPIYLSRADKIILDLMRLSYKHDQSKGSYFYASYPCFGLYKPFEVVNWGAKFASDAILTKIALDSSLQ